MKPDTINPPENSVQLDPSSLLNDLDSFSSSNTFSKKYFSRFIIGLSIAFCTMLLLVALVTWYGITNVTGVQHQMQTVVDNHMGKLISTTRMETAARLRIMNMYKMALLEDPFERDEISIYLQSLANDFTESRLHLLDLGITEKERQLLDKQGRLTGIALPLQRQLGDLFFEGKEEDARDLLISQVTDAQDNVSKTLKEIYDYQLDAANIAVENSNKEYLKTLNDMLWLAGFALFIGLVIMAIIIKLAFKTNAEREKHLNRLAQMNEAILVNSKELAKATEQANLATQKANIASETKSAFLANMSHEIRTPLTAIIGYAEDMIDNSKIRGRDFTSLQTITRNGKHLLQIINEILDISKIESGKLETELLDVSLFGLLEDVKSLLKLPAEEKGLAFEVVYNYPVPDIIHTDPTRLKQILLNLSYNAIKFTQQGQVSIEISFNQTDRLLVLEVKDSGIGMTETQLEKIFDTFTQGDSSTTREFGGTGLGLCISKILAEMLGGTITVESIQELGSAFTVTIDPGELNEESLVFAQPENTESILTSSNDNSTPKLSGAILLAEDTVDIQDLVTLLVEKTGASIDLADNGEIAVDKALRNSYDLVLMDMQMPKMDGLEAMKILRKNNFQKPIISLTANARKQDRENCRNAGCDNFISKPIDRQEFYSVLGKYLGGEKNNNVKSLDNSLDDISRKFVASLPEWLEEIKQAYTDDNNDSVAKLLHKMKGMGGSFGYPTLTDYSLELEELLEASNTQLFKSKFNDMENEILLIVNTSVNS